MNRKIYRSNLGCPDLQPAFPNATELDHNNAGRHVVLGDKTLFAGCGYATHDEAAIMYNLASVNRGLWVEIGAHTGWSTAHLAKPGNAVIAVEPELRRNMFNTTLDPAQFSARFRANLLRALGDDTVENDRDVHGATVWLEHTELPRTHGMEAKVVPLGVYSWDCLQQLTARLNGQVVGAFIDGEHNSPFPVVDAMLVAPMLAENSMVIFHDAIGSPVVAGVRWLFAWHQLKNHKVVIKRYMTPQFLTVVATGTMCDKLPDHTPDPDFDWKSFAATTDQQVNESLDRDFAEWRTYANGWTRRPLNEW